jgi:hypothetical protein
VAAVLKALEVIHTGLLPQQVLVAQAKANPLITEVVAVVAVVATTAAVVAVDLGLPVAVAVPRTLETLVLHLQRTNKALTAPLVS